VRAGRMQAARARAHRLGEATDEETAPAGVAPAGAGREGRKGVVPCDCWYAG